MKKTFDRQFYGIALRYLVLILVALPNLWLFYFVLTPLTMYPVYFLLKLFVGASIAGPTIILVNGTIPIELVRACIAGSAYYLLLILNLSIPGIKLGKRLLMISATFLSLLILNIARIFLLSLIYVSKSPLFDVTHEVFWYGLSTLFVVGIWFAAVKLFGVKNFPIYSDIKFLARRAKRKK